MLSGQEAAVLESEGNPYSYHTFLYPFLWSGKKGDGITDFEQVLGKDWVPDDMLDKQGQLAAASSGGGANLAQQLCDYQALQYFNAGARAALFRAGGDIVHSWVLAPERVHNRGRYIIDAPFRKTVKGKDEETLPWSRTLAINNIRLKLFNTRVAVIIFEAEYYPVKTQIDVLRRDVKRINEYGRRLYPAFLASEGDGFLLCADRLRVEFEGFAAEEDLRRRATEHCGSSAPSTDEYLRNPVQLPSIIRHLLTCGGSRGGGAYNVTCRQDEVQGGVFYIEPAIDDRMFVCCCVLDKEYAEHFLHGDHTGGETRQSGKYRYLADWETGRELYALTNIDPGDSSCQDRAMLDRCFEEQLYSRWFGYGTIYAVTSQSMVCVTGPDALDATVNPFLTLYVQMCTLVLVQRASLIAFDSRVTGLIASSQGSRKAIEGKNLSRLISITEDFAIFQGQLLLPELTPQIQGIELYEKLQRMLFIARLEQDIQEQLKNLYEIGAASQDRKQNFVLYVLSFLTMVSFVEDGSSYAGQFIETAFGVECPAFAVYGAAAAAAAVVAFVVWYLFLKGRGGRR